LLDLSKQLQAVHPQHVDVLENRHERGLNFLASRSNTSAPEAAKCMTPHFPDEAAPGKGANR
jgi:hypothetical protein